MLVSLNKETNLSKFRITFMDEDTRHVINLRECKRCMLIKNHFIIKIDSVLYTLTTYLDVNPIY